MTVRKSKLKLAQVAATRRRIRVMCPRSPQMDTNEHDLQAKFTHNHRSFVAD